MLFIFSSLRSNRKIMSFVRIGSRIKTRKEKLVNSSKFTSINPMRTDHNNTLTSFVLHSKLTGYYANGLEYIFMVYLLGTTENGNFHSIFTQMSWFIFGIIFVFVKSQPEAILYRSR